MSGRSRLDAAKQFLNSIGFPLDGADQPASPEMTQRARATAELLRAPEGSLIRAIASEPATPAEIDLMTSFIQRFGSRWRCPQNLEDWQESLPQSQILDLKGEPLSLAANDPYHYVEQVVLTENGTRVAVWSGGRAFLSTADRGQRMVTADLFASSKELDRKHLPLLAQAAAIARRVLPEGQETTETWRVSDMKIGPTDFTISISSGQPKIWVSSTLGVAVCDAERIREGFVESDNLFSVPQSVLSLRSLRGSDEDWNEDLDEMSLVEAISARKPEVEDEILFEALSSNTLDDVEKKVAGYALDVARPALLLQSCQIKSQAHGSSLIEAHIPLDEDWPSLNGVPYRILYELDCGKLPDVGLLPDAGWLQIFVKSEGIVISASHTPGADLFVRHICDDVPVRKMDDPNSGAEISPYVCDGVKPGLVRAIVDWDTPQSSDILDFSEDDVSHGFQADEFMQQLRGKRKAIFQSNYFGGYNRWTQEDPILDMGAPRYYCDAEEKMAYEPVGRRDIPAPFMSLLIVDGYTNIFVRPHDSRRGDFSRMRFHQDCT